MKYLGTFLNFIFYISQFAISVIVNVTPFLPQRYTEMQARAVCKSSCRFFVFCAIASAMSKLHWEAQKVLRILILTPQTTVISWQIVFFGSKQKYCQQEETWADILIFFVVPKAKIVSSNLSALLIMVAFCLQWWTVSVDERWAKLQKPRQRLRFSEIKVVSMRSRSSRMFWCLNPPNQTKNLWGVVNQSE